MMNAIQWLEQGIYVENATPSNMLRNLAEKLHPVKTQFDLIRIGSAHDGGYLLPNDLVGIRACFSPGVADNSNFEQDLFLKAGIESHLADFSVEGPPAGFVPKSFLKKYLGSVNNDTFVTLDSWVEEMEGPNGDYLLQMDIEGGEYSTLLSCSSDSLRQFRIIVLEVHCIYAWAQKNFFHIVECVFEKLLQQFYVLHNHPNNNDGLISLGGFMAPRTLELTFIRKDRGQMLGFCSQFPHPLDTANVVSPTIEDLKLPQNWFHKANQSDARKLLLSRPQGGWNDILCSVERCWSYAEKNNRELYVDTRQSGIRDDFWKYFSPLEKTGPVKHDLNYQLYDSLDVIPKAIRGRVSSLETDYSMSKGGFVDVVSDELVVFDPAVDYETALLVHEQGWLGGILTSVNLLERLQLTEIAKKDIKKRLKNTPKSHIGIHIRHTDYTTDYQAFIASIKSEVVGKNILICSDNVEVIDYVKNELHASNVFRLSTFQDIAGHRLHYRDLGDGQYASNIETLADLFALALSERIYFANVNEAGGRPSGFSLLAHGLHQRPSTVKRFLSI